MKAIQYTRKTGSNIIRLFYATCTNDFIIYSKQASNVEIFVLAFFIEFNRLFISDTVFMSAKQKQFIQNMKLNFHTKKSIDDWFLTHDKKAFLELFNKNNFFGRLNRKKRFELSNHLSYSVSKLF